MGDSVAAGNNMLLESAVLSGKPPWLSNS
jgi:hypothetical protein